MKGSKMVKKGINPYAAKSSKKRSEAPEVTLEPVPAGTAAAILEWVGDDQTRAQRALEVEQNGNGRKTVISKLEALLQ